MDKWKDYKCYGKNKRIDKHLWPKRVGARNRGGPDNKNYNYRGVRQRRDCKWVAEIKEPKTGRRIWLGTHKYPREAALAYDETAIALYGPRAKLNLLENPLSDNSCVQVTAVTEETVEDVKKDVPALVGKESLSTSAGVRLDVEPEFDVSDMEEIFDILNSSPCPGAANNLDNVEYGEMGKAMENFVYPAVNPDTEVLDTYELHNNLDAELLLDEYTSGVDYDFDFGSDYDFLKPCQHGAFNYSFDELNTMMFHSSLGGSNWA